MCFLQDEDLKRAIEEEHHKRWDAEAGALRRPKKTLGETGYLAAVVARMQQQWPGEMDFLISSDITNAKSRIWKCALQCQVAAARPYALPMCAFVLWSWLQRHCWHTVNAAAELCWLSFLPPPGRPACFHVFLRCAHSALLHAHLCLQPPTDCCRGRNRGSRRRRLGQHRRRQRRQH